MNTKIVVALAATLGGTAAAGIFWQRHLQESAPLAIVAAPEVRDLPPPLEASKPGPAPEEPVVIPPAPVAAVPEVIAPPPEPATVEAPILPLTKMQPAPAPRAALPAAPPAPAAAPKVNPDEPVDARAALSLVGLDAAAFLLWSDTINDPSLPENVRKNLIEDLNEDGFPDPKHPTADDIPLILNRMAMIEEMAPVSLDDVNAAAFMEAYKDLSDMLDKASQ